MDFKSSFDHYKDLKVMVDDLFEDFEKKKLDMYSICQSFIFFVVEVSYSLDLECGT